MRNKIDKYGLCLEEYTSNKNNADVYFKRAIGKYPEMEVSKALSKIVNKTIKNNEKVLDVGCATGHFYRSLKKRIKKNFFYTGCDPYEIFLKLARKAWKNEKNMKFIKANIYKLPFKKKSHDITYCSNVSYKIQLVYNNRWWKYTKTKPIDEFDSKGNPRSFSYFNIHSKDYLVALIKKLAPKSKIKFIKDNKFSKKQIMNSKKNEKRPLATSIIQGEQFSGCLMQPHFFVVIDL